MTPLTSRTNYACSRCRRGFKRVYGAVVRCPGGGGEAAITRREP